MPQRTPWNWWDQGRNVVAAKVDPIGAGQKRRFGCWRFPLRRDTEKLAPGLSRQQSSDRPRDHRFRHSEPPTPLRQLRHDSREYRIAVVRLPAQEMVRDQFRRGEPFRRYPDFGRVTKERRGAGADRDGIAGELHGFGGGGEFGVERGVLPVENMAVHRITRSPLGPTHTSDL
jgi:hypothetical protein